MWNETIVTLRGKSDESTFYNAMEIHMKSKNSTTTTGPLSKEIFLYESNDNSKINIGTGTEAL